MKSKKIFSFLILLLIVFVIKVPNIKAKQGLNEIGTKVQFCAYCNGKECFYTLKNKEKSNKNNETNSSVNRIFYKENTNSNIEEKSLGTVWGIDHDYAIIGDSCEKYLYFVEYDESGRGMNYYYVASSEESLDSVSSRFKGTFEKYSKYEYRYSWGYDSFGSGNDIDNEPLTKAVEQLINNQKSLENPSQNLTDPNNETNSGNSSNQTDSTGYKCAVDHEDDVACGSLYFIPPQLPFLTNLLMNLIKIATPIVLIIKGLIDLFKAETSVTYIEISKTRAKFFKRLVPAIAVFLVVMLVQLVVGLVASGNENNTFLACTNCFLNNNCEKTPQDKIDNYCKDMQPDPTIINGNGYNGGANDTSNNGNTPQSTGKKTGNCTAVNVFNKITYEQAKTGLSNAISSETTSRGKAVAAANYLSTNFPKLPYHWGGKSRDGINKEWGSCKTTSTQAGHSTAGTLQPFGMDCSGFVTWAMWQAGYSGEYMIANEWGNILPSKKYEIKGKTSTYLESIGVQVGDLVWHSGHIGIIIGKDSKGFIIAHEKGQSYGLTKEYLDDNISPNGKGFTHVILMDDFYKKF